MPENENPGTRALQACGVFVFIIGILAMAATAALNGGDMLMDENTKNDTWGKVLVGGGVTIIGIFFVAFIACMCLTVDCKEPEDRDIERAPVAPEARPLRLETIDEDTRDAIVVVGTAASLCCPGPAAFLALAATSDNDSAERRR